MTKNNSSKPPGSSPLIGELSESLEDYIEIIYDLIKEQKVARVRDIAKAKDVKMSSVVSAVKRLHQEGLVKYEAREFIELTEIGLDLAQRIRRRHDFLTRFLVDVLQIDPKIAESDACSMEHAISSVTMERLYDFAKFLQSQPWGIDNVAEKYRKSYRGKSKIEGD